MRLQRFSQRTGWDLTETEWARRLRERRAAGLPILDLTASNPTHCGFDYDAQGTLAALGNPASLDYDPDPKGLRLARAGVAGYYADHGATVDLEHVFLTTSTSEAYSFLFRLLCDPGDEVLIAQPSYPLFDFLADLNDVRLVPYPLFYDCGWHLDPEALRLRITSRTRAIAVVHPNNPTGHFTKPAERAVMEQLCADHGLALIVDEVFLDYSLAHRSAETEAQSFAGGDHPVLTFVLSGLSKVAALPQMKAAWIICQGPTRDLQNALERLDVIADTFLSMNAPIQWALPHWMAGRAEIQAQILARVRTNLATLDHQLGSQSVISRLAIEAGWYVVLRIPATQSDAQTAFSLLEQYGVAIHSGGFFGFRDTGWLGASLLGVESEFRNGISQIAAHLKRIHD